MEIAQLPVASLMGKLNKRVGPKRDHLTPPLLSEWCSHTNSQETALGCGTAYAAYGLDIRGEYLMIANCMTASR